MEACSLRFVAESCGGDVECDSGLLLSGVSTDTRRLKGGELFVALEGDSFDGHEFVREAEERGALAAMVQTGRRWGGSDRFPRVWVADTRRALGDMAKAYRRRVQVPVIVVGGSSGKTSTKNLVASVVGSRLRTLSSEASYNNDIGVPLTLLRLEHKHEVAVLEAGTNHPGELAPLVRMIGPRDGIITNIGPEHLEFFADLAGVAEEECAVAEHLPAEGCLFLEGTSPWAEQIVKRTAASVVRFGRDEGNDWRLRGVRLDWEGTEFDVETGVPGWSGSYRTRLLGAHQALNGVAAIAVGYRWNLTREEVQRGLEACRAAPGRMALRQVKAVYVLDDSYNANEASMRAALEAVRDLPVTGRRLAVLGGMSELGRESEGAHAAVGEAVAGAGVEQLWVVGEMGRWIGAAAERAGVRTVVPMAGVEGTGEAVAEATGRGDVVLVKGSRAVGLEKVVRNLEERLRGAAGSKVVA